MNGVRFFTKLISVSQIPFKITTIAIIPESMKWQFSLWYRWLRSSRNLCKLLAFDQAEGKNSTRGHVEVYAEKEKEEGRITRGLDEVGLFKSTFNLRYHSQSQQFFSFHRCGKELGGVRARRGGEGVKWLSRKWSKPHQPNPQPDNEMITR